MVTGSVNYGRLVCSIAGRDKGNYYLVYKVDEKMVYLVDGRNRKVANPKKKNIKHINILNCNAEKIIDKIRSGKKVTDLEVREALKLCVGSIKKV